MYTNNAYDGYIMSILIIVSSYKVDTTKAIKWCQRHTPFRWARHSIPCNSLPGMWQFGRTAYEFRTHEDAMLFKLTFGGTCNIT